MSPQYGELNGPLAAEIISLVWGTPANVNGFRVLAALLHGTLVVFHISVLAQSQHLYVLSCLCPRVSVSHYVLLLFFITSKDSIKVKRKKKTYTINHTLVSKQAYIKSQYIACKRIPHMPLNSCA